MIFRLKTCHLVAVLALSTACIYSVAEEERAHDNADYKDYIAWLEKAEAGDSSAQFQVALRHRSGRGVPKDEAKAAEWFEKAALQGHVDSQRMIALSYSLGRGVAVDKVKALEWFRKAAEQGDAHSQFQLGVSLIGDSPLGAAMNMDLVRIKIWNRLPRGTPKPQARGTRKPRSG